MKKLSLLLVVALMLFSFDDSTEVEVVSGATVTSNAIIEAINNALAAQ